MYRRQDFTRSVVLFFLTILPILGYGQFNQNHSTSDIKEQIEKLGKVGSVLYIAAHPDDENTSLISYFSNKEHLRTSYLAITRGDGGQNLIGAEINELLGVIRTQELLAARRVDGGFQYFSRANDFGYSKNSEETLRIWDKDKVLADVVWIIRKTQPDIIINRFDHTGEGRTHGHHTASAILSVEAFDLAADSTAFPEQLKYVDLWQPKRLFFNTSWWFYGSIENFRAAHKEKFDSLNIGVYLSNLGFSNSEISALSRSMHKSQGFGRAGARGVDYDYLKLIKGNKELSDGIMTGITTSLDRIEPSGKLDAVYQQLRADFEIEEPEISIEHVLEMMRILESIDDNPWKKVKLQQAEELLKSLTGLFVKASTHKAAYTPADSINVDLEVISRNSDLVIVQGISYLGKTLMNKGIKLDENIGLKLNFDLLIPEDIQYTSPYWLRDKWSIGMYEVKNQELRGKPENDPALTMQVHLLYKDKPVTYDCPIIYNIPDRIKGEILQPLAIVPEISINADQAVYIYNKRETKPISVEIKAWENNIHGYLNIEVPEGWEITGIPSSLSFEKAGDKRRLELNLTPPAEASEGNINFSFVSGEKVYNKRLDVIDYDHIPTQYVLRNAMSKVVKLDLKKGGKLIGYIEGAGDKIPIALRQMGYTVNTLSEKEILTDKLDKYDAIVTGIRAHNTNKKIKAYQPHLMNYVQNGGTLIVQYTTVQGMLIDEIGPYPITLSHERVSEEDAEVKFLQPDHPLLNEPNKISSKDFDNWVQERGLYFATKWDDRYTPILAAHDKGEPDLKGGMLVAQYGKGHYIYTGYSWFRELPAGVSGAYRIFANLVSLGNNNTE